MIIKRCKIYMGYMALPGSAGKQGFYRLITGLAQICREFIYVKINMCLGYVRIHFLGMVEGCGGSILRQRSSY